MVKISHVPTHLLRGSEIIVASNDDNHVSVPSIPALASMVCCHTHDVPKKSIKILTRCSRNFQIEIYFPEEGIVR